MIVCVMITCVCVCVCVCARARARACVCRLVTLWCLSRFRSDTGLCCLCGLTVGDVRTVVEPLVCAAVRSAGFVVYDVTVPRGSEDCQFAAIADQVGQARPACQPTCDDARRDIAAWLEQRYDELHHFLPDTDGADVAAWARQCQGYSSGTHAGDELTLRGAAGVYGCRICVVGRWGSVWYEPPGGACTDVLTLVYFDATDYRHYSLTRPLATRPPVLLTLLRMLSLVPAPCAIG
jgi:hypothetical protein